MLGLRLRLRLCLALLLCLRLALALRLGNRLALTFRLALALRLGLRLALARRLGLRLALARRLGLRLALTFRLALALRLGLRLALTFRLALTLRLGLRLALTFRLALRRLPFERWVGRSPNRLPGHLVGWYSDGSRLLTRIQCELVDLMAQARHDLAQRTVELINPLQRPPGSRSRIGSDFARIALSGLADLLSAGLGSLRYRTDVLFDDRAGTVLDPRELGGAGRRPGH